MPIGKHEASGKHRAGDGPSTAQQRAAKESAARVERAVAGGRAGQAAANARGNGDRSEPKSK